MSCSCSVCRFQWHTDLKPDVRGELQRINTTQAESVNVLETRLVLDRVRDRLDAAASGHNWRTTKPDFTSVLFTLDDLKELLIKFPPKNPSAVQSLAVGCCSFPQSKRVHLQALEEEKAKAQAAVAKVDTPPPAISVSSFDSCAPFFLSFFRGNSRKR